MDKEILFQFISMDLIQFATFSDNYVDDEKDIEVSNKFRFSYNFEEDLMCCMAYVTLSKENSVIILPPNNVKAIFQTSRLFRKG